MPAPSAKASRAGRYFDLVAEFRLRPIRSREELADAIAIVERLADRGDLDDDERDYQEALETFVVAYEAEHFPSPPSSPADYLRQLIEDGGRTRSAVAAGTGLSESTISDILSGRRVISPKARRAFAEFFAVDPSLFD